MESRYSKKIYRSNVENKGIAIITARGGSKGIENKNIRKINGKPLIGYTIEAAIKSNIFSKIVVTTDSEKIAAISMGFGAEIINRPSELSQDLSRSFDAVEHAIEELKGKDVKIPWLAVLQPTSPLRNSNHLHEAFELFEQSRFRNVVSVCEVSEHPYKMFQLRDQKIEYLSKDTLELPRQELPKFFKCNGAIYLITINDFESQRRLVLKDFEPYLMKKSDSIDIDVELDLKIVENILSNEDI